MNGNGTTRLTPTEQKLLAILGDGLLHPREELHTCLPDELGGENNLQVHICNMRKKLRPAGQSIACEMLEGRANYHLVRLIRRS